MKPAQLNKLITDILEEHKAENIINIEVRRLSSVTDYMTICSATSSRHIKALANHVVTKLKEHKVSPLGTEGWDSDSDWMVLDYGSTIVHIMLPHTRDYYYLEKLWGKIEPHKPTAKAASKKVISKASKAPKISKASKTSKPIKVPKTSKAKKTIRTTGKARTVTRKKIAAPKRAPSKKSSKK
jgi:ribosome-associated protein